MGRRIQISEEVQRQVIYNYVELKQGLLTSVKPFGLSQFLVERILKENGIKKRTYTESKQEGRKYPCNDNFFKTQSSEMAYILGFLATDGNIGKKENCISIELQHEDLCILEKMKEITESTRPISEQVRKQTGNTTNSWKVWSKEWKEDLNKYGITPKKTFTLQPPTLLNPEFRKDYIRGFFDGDGSIYHLKENNRTFVEIVSASQNVIDWIREELTLHYGICINKKITEKKSNGTIIYKIKIGSLKEINKIYHIFYDDTNLYLPRKKEKFEALLNIPRDSNSSDEE